MYCKLGGAVQTGYAGSGRGVALRWEALDSNDQVVSCHVVVTNETWANGVGTFTGRLSSVAPTAEKLRLTVAYAGEEQTDDSSIIGAGTMVAPSTLHVFSGGGTLRINAVALNPSELTLAAYSGDTVVDLSDYLEMAEDGTPVGITTGWDGNVWEHTVQAKTSAPGGTLTLQLMHGQEELATANISIADTIAATVTAPDTLDPGDDLTATVNVTSPGHSITRLPADTVILRISADTDEDTGNAENETEIEATYEDVAEGSLIVVQAIDSRDGTVLASKNVRVHAIKTMLAEAINERLIAKGEAGTYTDEDSLYTLWGGALSAMQYFANASGVAADGTYTPYTATAESTGIPNPTDPDTDELGWVEAAYEAVCTAKSKSAGYETSMTGYDCAASYTGSYEMNPTPPPTYINGESEATCKNKAMQRAEWEEDSDYRGWKAYTGGSCSSMYGSYSAVLHAYYSENKIRCTISNPNVDVRADYYFRGYQNGAATWDSLGHTVAPNGQTVKLFSNSCAEGGSFGWVDAGNTRPTLAFESGKGYEMVVAACIVTYGFKHG